MVTFGASCPAVLSWQPLAELPLPAGAHKGGLCGLMHVPSAMSFWPPLLTAAALPWAALQRNLEFQSAQVVFRKQLLLRPQGVLMPLTLRLQAMTLEAQRARGWQAVSAWPASRSICCPAFVHGAGGPSACTPALFGGTAKQAPRRRFQSCHAHELVKRMHSTQKFTSSGRGAFPPPHNTRLGAGTATA